MMDKYVVAIKDKGEREALEESSPSKRVDDQVNK